jgi:ferredoxin
MSLDQSRCVSCFNCLHVCPQSVISYQPSFKKITKVDFSPQRRSFIITSASAAGLIIFTLNSNIRNLVGNLFAKKADMPITPPGSLGFTHYSQTCSACHLCVSACPTKVITPAFMEYGLTGIMQPKMDYEKSYCDYECNICGRVCPTGAIRPFTLQDKKLIQVGTAELLQDRCVVYTKKQNCGACLEVCPTHTLYSINENNILYPKTDLQYCIGCGACEKACPTSPKSIIVRSNPIHKKAIKYVAKVEPIQQKNKIDKSFPF